MRTFGGGLYLSCRPLATSDLAKAVTQVGVADE
jgi:hypothetical protein